jgi:hypothetical protein
VSIEVTRPAVDVDSSSGFLSVIEDLGCPTANFCGFTFSGREAWRDVAPRLTPGERRKVLAILRHRLLLATASGRARLRRWLDAGQRQIPLSRPELRKRVASTVYGDECFVPLIEAALRCVPAFVLATVLREVAFLTVGLNSRAWTGSSSFVDRLGRRRTRVILLGPGADLRTVLHEIGHVWHASPDQEHVSLISALGNAGLIGLARQEGWMARVTDHRLLHERLAEAHAVVWQEPTLVQRR